MRHSPENYAKALAEAASGFKTEKEGSEAVEKFLRLVRINGDGRKLPKILAAAERAFCSRFGLKKILIESARPLKERAAGLFKNFIKREDFVEEVVNPELIAGVRITVNGEFTFNESLKGKLDKIFS